MDGQTPDRYIDPARAICGQCQRNARNDFQPVLLYIDIDLTLLITHYTELKQLNLVERLRVVVLLPFYSRKYCELSEACKLSLAVADIGSVGLTTCRPTGCSPTKITQCITRFSRTAFARDNATLTDAGRSGGSTLQPGGHTGPPYRG